MVKYYGGDILSLVLKLGTFNLVLSCCPSSSINTRLVQLRQVIFDTWKKDIGVDK